MNNEIATLIKNETWINLLEKQLDQNKVFKHELDENKKNTSFTWHKACLIANVMNQRCGVDFTKTFSLMIKPTMIWLILSITVTHNWELHQLDVSNTSLHDILEEVIYKKQPPNQIMLVNCSSPFKD